MLPPVSQRLSRRISPQIDAQCRHKRYAKTRLDLGKKRSKRADSSLFRDHDKPNISPYKAIYRPN
jgi:hypothetical protein